MPWVSTYTCTSSLMLRTSNSFLSHAEFCGIGEICTIYIHTVGESLKITAKHQPLTKIALLFMHSF